MDTWIWVVVIAVIIFLIIDWFIIMGFNPRNWKGGEKKDEQRKTSR